jgi:hypothetical protein
MATQYANGKIVTSGLILSLDASDRNSYPGSGFDWKDLSGNNNNFYTNTFTYDNSTKSFTNNVEENDSRFIHRYNNIDSTEFSTYTLNLTFNRFNSLNSTPKILLGQYNIFGTSALLTLAIGIDSPDILYISPNSIIENLDWSPISTISTNTNYILTISSNQVSNITTYYLNGVYIGSIPTFTTVQQVAIGGDAYTQFFGGFYSFLGRIYNYRLYNRVLSAQEVLQNYNAQKSRFNL